MSKALRCLLLIAVVCLMAWTPAANANVDCNDVVGKSCTTGATLTCYWPPAGTMGKCSCVNSIWYCTRPGGGA